MTRYSIVKLTYPDSVNVYISLGHKSTRLLRLSQDDIEKGTLAEPIECTFPAPKPKKGKKKAEVDEEDEDGRSGKAKKKTPISKKAKAPSGKKSKKPLDDEKDIPSNSGSENEDLLEIDDESDHGFDGIESSSEAEDGWKVEISAQAAKSRGPTSR